MPIDIRSAMDEDVPSIIALWHKCDLSRDYNNPDRDIAFARSGPSSDILVGETDGKIVGSVMVGYDGHRGYVYYVAADPDHAGQGIGRRMMDAAEAWLKDRDVWKLNLMVRESNLQVLGFYDAIGYERQPRAVLTKWLEEPGVLPDD